MNKSERLKALLSLGYFPSELPPPFNTKDLGKFRKHVSENWPDKKAPATTPSIYSAQRLGRKRRNLSIVNPISQFFLCKEIAESWVEIRKTIQDSKTSLDTAELHKDAQRAILKPDFSRVDFMRLHAGGNYDHVLVSDISRFYGTIYTHSIPWALHGKAWCKKNRFSKAYSKSLGDRLDRCVRRGQGDQTLGIPVGPDTSRVISELVAVGVERRYLELSGCDGTSAFRFVDDWFIGHDEARDAEAAIRNLAEASAEYELELDLEKTKILDAKDEIVASWPTELADLMVSSNGPKSQVRQLHRFFSRAFELALDNPQNNVMDYALKLARSFRIHKDCYTLFESFILRCARAYPIILPTVVQILVNYRKDGAPVSSDRCRKLIIDELRKSVALRHSDEVAWVLFLAKALSIKLPAKQLAPICRTENSVWALLVLDLEQMGLIEGKIDKGVWVALMSKQSLTDSNWLLAYEADLKGWLKPKGVNHVDSDTWFSVLKKRRISFYDVHKNVETFRNSRRVSEVTQRLRRSSAQLWLDALLKKYTM